MIKIDKITIPTVPLFFRCSSKKQRGREIIPWSARKLQINWWKYNFHLVFPAVKTKSLDAI